MPGENAAQRAPARPRSGPRTPGHRIVDLLGGPKSAAEMAGRDISQVYRWLAAEKDGGLGGRIPFRAQNDLIAAAAARSIALSHRDFAPRRGEAFL